MAEIALAWSVEGDYEVRGGAFDTEHTMDGIVKILANFAVGRWVPEQPDRVMRIRRHGETELLRRDMTVREAGFVPWEFIELIFE